MTPEEALRAYTVWPARASGIEALTGTIKAGKWADLTILSADPLNVILPGDDGVGIAARDFLNGRIEMTIVGGKIVYQK